MLKKWSKKKILLCPVCGKPYEYCHGEVKTPYFRHMDKAECEDKYSESETEEHLNGKRDLYEWIKKQNGVENAVLEGWIPETKQRPDIMFNYKPLLKLLIDKGMTKTQLREQLGISMSTLAKISKNEYISMKVLDNICSLVNCKIEDVIEHQP